MPVTLNNVVPLLFFIFRVVLLLSFAVVTAPEAIMSDCTCTSDTALLADVDPNNRFAVTTFCILVYETALLAIMALATCTSDTAPLGVVEPNNLLAVVILASLEKSIPAVDVI